MSTENAAGQHTVLEQAQAAADAQADSERPTAQEGLLQDTDLVTPDTADDDVPPPAYGDSYGAIRNEKSGLGTAADVTDDGRVNIRINQLNRRLSQIFTPALREQVKNAEDSEPPPPPYIPASLGGDERVPPPPPLNVVIHVVGSRGDVQPFVALGKVLKNTYGHRVRLATHPNFRSFVQENGLEFFSIGADPSRLMAFMVKNGPGLMPSFRSVVAGDVTQRRKDVAEYIQGCWRSCYKASDGEEDISETAARSFVADCIIANPPSFAHIHCAEKLGIPLHIMFTMPYSPTQAFPHPLANVQSSADPQMANYISYVMIELLSWQGLGDIINRFRAKCLGLEPVSLISAPGMLQRLKIPHTYCWSPALIPKPKDWGSHISISGFYFLSSNYTPQPDLKAFLDAGPPPIYIGFGSIVLEDPDALTDLIFTVVRKTGQRVLLSKGWGGMGAGEVPEGVFMLGNVPHDWLFKHTSCVVHHGGAGTTAAGIAAGRPTLIVPFFGDQPFWGAMVARAGAGPDPIPYRQLTVETLIGAIDFCLRPESLERAKDLASKISEERGSGSEMGAQSFHQHLEVDNLRCFLEPSRAATWRIKRTQVRLSAFAACTLANAGQLDFHDLKLYRPREYYTDEGPSDPFSGFATGVLRAFSGMAMGIGEVPTETVKAFTPSGYSRQKSQASVSTSSEKSAKLSAEGDQVSRRQSKLSTTLRKPASPSRKSSSHSTSSSSTKDYDMLRQTAHGSKGFGRVVKSAVLAPMDMPVGITKGFHNAPRLWGDDTVRPNERVTDMKSGFTAVGKEFGFGMYDGLTGVVTQPWKGARKEGAAGFAKGVGRGLGGLVFKPGAALWGIPSHFMKGATKEVQKLFGSSVQNYIVASRTAQGYDEWLQSFEEEKRDVLERWKVIRPLLKKKGKEGVQDVLRTPQKTETADEVLSQTSGEIHSAAQSVSSADTTALSTDGRIQASTARTIPRRPISTTVDEKAAQEARENAEEDSNVFNAIRENITQLRDSRLNTSDESRLSRAITASESEAQQRARALWEYEAQVERAIAQSLREQKMMASDNEGGLGTENDQVFELDGRPPADQIAGGAPVTTAPQASQHPPAYDPAHLEGTTQSEFEAQQRDQTGEKTALERTEEEVVMAYIKKQSLLEVRFRSQGKKPAGEEDEELERAWEASMRDHWMGSGEGSSER